ATRAPSGDNTQPWLFLIDEAAQRIDVHLDTSRDTSPMNRGQRMARMALGAALENLLRTAQENDWEARLDDGHETALASVQLLGEAPQEVKISRTVANRVTNRRLYDSRPVPPTVLAQLQRDACSL